MASIAPISDRRARMSLVLAVVGMPSFGVTLPAAVWLGAAALRQQRLSSGAEPVMGFLALVVTGIDVLFIHQAAVRLAGAVGAPAAWAAAGWAAALAAAILLCSAASLRIHPERRAAVLAVRGALIAGVAGGIALLFQLLSAVGS